MPCPEGLNMGETNSILEVWGRRMKTNGNPDLNPFSTGKVYLRRKTEVLLKNVYFSNVDLNFYTKTGNSYPLSDFSGRNWSVKFTITETDRFGNEHKFQSQFDSPLPLGELEEIDWKGIPDGERFQAELGVQTGALSGYDDPYLQKFLGTGTVSFMISQCPGKTVEEIKPLIWFISFLFLFDDQIDNNSVFTRPLSIAELQIICEKLSKILDGNHEEEVPEFPMMKPLCKYLHYLREYFIEEAVPEVAELFFQGVKNYINASILDNSEEWKQFKGNSSMLKRAYPDLRRLDSAVLPLIELVLLQYQISLPPEIQNCFLWQYFKNRCADHIWLVNDLLSFKKERMENETTNIVYTGHYFEGRELRQVLENCVDDVNTCAKDIREFGEVLLKLFGNNEDLVKAVKILQSGCLTHILWYNRTPRYQQKDLVFDAVIHEDENKY